MPTLGLRGKLVVGSTGMVLAFLAAGVAVFSQLLASYADRQIEVELTNARLSAASHLRLERNVLRERAANFAQLPVLRAALGTHDRATIDDAVQSLLGRDGRELLVLWQSGLLGGSATPGDIAELQRALDRVRSDGSAELLFTAQGRLFAGVVVSVRDAELELARLLLAEAVDDTAATELASATGHDVMLVHGHRVWGTGARFGVPFVARPDEIETLFGLEERGQEATAYRFDFHAGGQVRGGAVAALHPGGGIVLLSRPADRILELQRSAWQTLVFVAVVVGGIGVLACLRLARRMARPLEHLTRAAEAIAAGNLDVRVQATGHDEIGRLGVSFDHMASTMHALVTSVREQAELATAANRAKDGFLMSVSHELRTPATNIRAYAEILRDFSDDTRKEERQGFLDVIAGQADLLESLIASVLDYSQLEAGGVQFHFETGDFAAMVEEACVLFESRCRQKHLELARAVQGPLPVRADRVRSRKLLHHLLDNAVKFSPEGGRIEVTLQREGAAAELRVRDHGPGVPDEVKARIFERFYQHGDTLTAKPPGLGLGLSFATTIAAAHGGSVTCEDAPGGGAVFVVRIPLAPANVAAIAWAATAGT